MMTRTQHRTVHFNAPFLLSGFEAVQPPGDYEVQEDEELIQGISWQAYRRVATLMTLPSRAVKSTSHRLVRINPQELETALLRDAGGEPLHAALPGASPRSQ
jgi:hypothetical protein